MYFIHLLLCHIEASRALNSLLNFRPYYFLFENKICYYYHYYHKNNANNNDNNINDNNNDNNNNSNNKNRNNENNFNEE